MTLRTTYLSAIAAAALMAAAPTGAKAGIEAGGLTCQSAGGVGYVVTAVLNVECAFAPVGGGPAHHYVGVIHRYGVDLGVTQGMALGWAVFAPTAVIHPGDLAGVYGGVQGNASVGVGGGANVLFGGSANTFALQPASLEGQIGVNVSAGVTGLELHPIDGPLPHSFHHRHHHKH